IQESGVKTVSAVVPSNLEDTDRWIADNHEKILRMPVPVKEVACCYEVLDTQKSEKIIEVTFIRKAVIEAHEEFFRAAGLTLTGLSYGVRDAMNILYFQSQR